MQTAELDLLDVDPFDVVWDEEPFTLASPVVAHQPGGHNQQSHAGDGVPNALDKLKLASRIKLGAGQRLLSSRKFKTSDDGGHVLLAAEVDTPQGREVRLGIVDPDESRHWTAASDAARTQRRAELDGLLNDMDPDDDRFDELDAERDSLDDPNPTVTVSPEAVAAMRTELAAGAETAQAWAKDWNAQIGPLREREDAIYGPHRSLPTELTDAERAQIDQLYQDLGEPDPYLAQGSIPIAGGAALAYRVSGDGEDSPATWRVDMAVRPADADEDWDVGVVTSAVRFGEKDVKGLLAGLAELAGDPVKAAARPRRAKTN